MPSVRVKRQKYSSLAERPQIVGADRPPRSLADLFRRSPSDQGPTVSEPVEPSSLSAQATVSRSPFPLTGLPRATTRSRSGSRVYDHVTKGSLRLLQTPLLSEDRERARTLSHGDSHRLTASPRISVDSGMVTIEGDIADIQVPGDGEPGRVGTALSLPRRSATSVDGQGVSVEDDDDHHHDDIVEHLDVIDPQVATVANLANAANAILIPPLSLYSRKPVVDLSPPPLPTSPASAGDEEQGRPILEDSLDRHVDDVMRRRAKIRRTLKGVWSFLKTPMGIVTGIYGFLVVFWGAAIVIFLAKIINFHNANTQGFWVEVSSQVENGLFTVTGIGLIPSRVLDTYRISKIWYYKRRTKKLRAKAGLPQLFDVDDLPDPAYDPNYVHVLTDEEQKDLHRQQVKFQHHQTWYRAHGTETHRAFPINYALLICCLNDGNSIFQIILCGTMWGLNRFERPAWSTGILIPASFLCGIFAAVFIALGGAKTKRTAEVEEKLKAALAMDYPDDHLHNPNAPNDFYETRSSGATPHLKGSSKGINETDTKNEKPADEDDRRTDDGTCRTP